ncbi:MAG: histidine phosphatase family protein, partial [Dehalococcoidia bacterium]
RWQAQRLADSLAGEKITAVYSSPLQRALNTAGPIAAACGLEPVVNEDLIEMNVGVLDGLPFTEIQERYPDLMSEWAGKSGADVWMPAGERLRDVAVRSWDALVSIARDHSESDIVVVSHNFVILTALARALEFELSQFRRLRHTVAAVSVLEFQGDRVSVVSINDTCHLRSDD